MKTLRIALLSVAVLFGGSSAQALDFSLGEVVVQNLGDFGYTATNSRLSFDGNATDELYQMFGYVGNANDHFRVDGTNFDVTSAIAETAPGQASSTVTLNATGAAALGLSDGAFSVTYDYLLTDDTVTPNDIDFMTWNVTLTNNSAAALTLSFYAYLDFDLAGDFGDDEANFSGGSINVNDSGASRPFWWTPTTVAASQYQIGGYPSVRNDLDAMTDNTTALTGGGPFGPADFTGALRFDLTINAGDSVVVGMNLPNVGSAWMLLMGLAGLAVAPRTIRNRKVEA